MLKNVTLFRGFGGFDGAPCCCRMPRCSLVLEDATLLLSVEECHAVQWFLRMPHCSVVLKDARLLRGVDGSHGAPW